MSLQNQYSVTVSVGGDNLGVFSSLTGGNVTADEVKHRPGAMAPAESLGGPRSVENVTVSRLYKRDRDHAIVHDLANQVGRAEAVATKQPLDADGNAFGRPIVYTGTLIGLAFPDADSESSDAAMLELEISTDGDIG